MLYKTYNYLYRQRTSLKIYILNIRQLAVLFYVKCDNTEFILL